MARSRSLGWLALVLFGALPQRALAQEKPRATERVEEKREPMLVCSGQVSLAVTDTERALLAIGEVARALGGRSLASSERQVVVELPTSRRGELVPRLARIGKIERHHFSTEDASFTIAEAEARARAAHGTRARMVEVRAKAQNVAEGLAAEREIERAEKDAASAQARVNELREKSRVTRVVIGLSAPSRETIVAPELPFPWLKELGLSSLYEPSRTQSEEDLELRAFLDGAMFVETGYARDAEPLDGHDLYVAGGLSMRALGEANPIGLFGGFDLALGGGGGFLYEVQTLFGVGVPIGRRIAVGLGSGPGIDGMTGGVIDFGVVFPVELYLSLDVASWLGVTLWARDGWVLASEERKDGSDLALFGDESSAGVTLAFAPLAERESMGPYSEERLGVEIGFGARELLGTRIYELRLGWGGWDADFSTSH